MFGQSDNRAKTREMTLKDIQGFPKDKKNQTIHEIVRDIRLKEQSEQKKGSSLVVKINTRQPRSQLVENYEESKTKS